jgi:hypothetical protein
MPVANRFQPYLKPVQNATFSEQSGIQRTIPPSCTARRRQLHMWHAICFAESQLRPQAEADNFFKPYKGVKIMKTYMENQQKASSTESYPVRAGKKSNLIKAIIIGIVFMGASYAGAVYADCPEITKNEDWYLSMGSPEQRSDLGYSRTNRSSETMATSNIMDESWYLSLGTPEQQPGFGGRDREIVLGAQAVC